MTRAYAITNHLEIWDAIPVAPAKLLALTESRKTAAQTSGASGAPVDPMSLRQAASFLEPDAPYSIWRDYVAGIGAANCPEARQIAHEFSEGKLDRLGRYRGDARPGNYTGPEAVDVVLDTMPPKEGGIGVGTIDKAARNAGWPGTLAPRLSANERFKDFVQQQAEADASDASIYPKPKTASEMANGTFPVPFYAWKNFILAEHVNSLYGDGGAGKTLLLLMVAVAGAAGIPLFGSATVQMPVLLVLAEDDYGATKARLEAISRILEVSLTDLPLRIWCLPGADLNIATVADDGTWAPGPFLPPLRSLLAEIGQPVLLGIDTVSDFAALDETKRLAVNTLCKQVLGGLCRDFGATVIVNAHPSKASMADGSGYAGSTAWNNAVRSRLTLERPDANSDRRVLRVAKSNYGSNAELELHMLDGVFWQHDQGDAADLNERLMIAAVTAAEAAAEQGTPVQAQRRPPKWVFDEIEHTAGRRPSRRELLEVLDYASRAGKVRYLKGNSKRMAGYYPWDEQRAAELAAEAKRHQGSVESLTSSAKKREVGHE